MIAAIMPPLGTADLEAAARAANEAVAALEAELVDIPAKVDAAIDASDAPLVNRLRRREQRLPDHITAAKATAREKWHAFHAARAGDLKAQRQQDLERTQQAQGHANAAGYTTAQAFAAAFGKICRANEANAKAEAALAGDPEVERRVLLRDATWPGWLLAFAEALAGFMQPGAAPPDRAFLDRLTDGRGDAYRRAYDGFFGER